MEPPFGDKELELDYPCDWEYTLIGSSEAEVRSAVAEVVGTRPHRLSFSHTSKGGKYVSLKLDLTVVDEADRKARFEELAPHANVGFVV